MRQTFILIALLFSQLVLSQISQNPEKSANPILLFKTLEIERDSIPYGSKDLFVFEFENDSKKPVTIQNVQTSCGCTAAEKPTEPIEPGKISKISVSYDTTRIGSFTKTITVSSDISDPIVLTIRGSVLPKKE
jgi:hypothetical protein